MRWSKTYIYTLKESPADAEIPSHKLMVRAGFIKKLAPGIYTYGHLALRAIRKFENIIREELAKEDAVEILMPVVQPKELWLESRRWKEMGDGLLKFQNRNGHEFCLGATHEEAVSDYVRHDLQSYRDLPKIVYQIQTKYRDEIRPRFGLMRGREFIMKDAYSFDLDQAGAQSSYKKMYSAYQRIFARLGLRFVIVQADTGNIGGNQSHEFHVLAESGEDHLLVADDNSIAANVEVCPSSAETKDNSSVGFLPKSEFPTPKLRTIKELSVATGLTESDLVKTIFFDINETEKTAPQPICVLVRGNDEVNGVKIKNFLKLANPPRMLNDKEVQLLTGAEPGSCGPVGLTIPVYMDRTIDSMRNFIVGANKDDYHYKNVNHGRDFSVTAIGDFRIAREGDRAPNGKGILKSHRGIEVGHVFYLGTKYSDLMGVKHLDKTGKGVLTEMGCYGIGVTRTIQAAIEQCHDVDGMIWPRVIAPYDVHITLLDPSDPGVVQICDKIESELKSQNIECLVDDRDERPGIKFKDADLLGMPLRLNIGAKGLAKGEIEIVIRKTKEKKTVETSRAVEATLALWPSS